MSFLFLSLYINFTSNILDKEEKCEKVRGNKELFVKLTKK